MTRGSEGNYPVDAVAAAWLTKMRGEESGPLRAELDAWLQASPDHREAYDRLRRQMNAANILKTSARHGTAHSAKRRSKLPGWISWGAAAAAVALLIVVVGVGGASVPGIPSGGTAMAIAAEPLVTRKGEIRTFRLADGSRAVLDTDSRLEVALGNNQRQVRLIKGRVRLSVARSDSPFHIEAGQGALTLQDGDLDVGVDTSGAVTLILRRGEAKLCSGGSDLETSLSPGKSLVYSGDSSSSAVAASADAMPRDWPEGWADYRSIRLDRLVAKANRYAEIPIVIDDAATAALEASGRFHISQTDAFAERVALLFDLRIERKSDAIYLRRR